MTDLAKRTLRIIDSLIDAYNVAQEAQQRFADAHVAHDPDETSDALYEATYALCGRLEHLLHSVEFQNILLGLKADDGQVSA